MMRKFIIFMFSLLILSSIHQKTSAETFDHSKFDRILKQYVDHKGMVDYNRISKDSRFKEYMESLKSAKVEELSRNSQLALWLNAYNAVTIDKVIKWKPKKSVRETLFPGVWTSTKFFTTREHVVAGKNVQAKLEEVTRKYINSSRGTRINYTDKTLYLSKIFDWFSGDFKFKSGSVLGFINPYLSKEAMSFLEQGPKISYIHYDWALNAKEPLQ